MRRKSKEGETSGFLSAELADPRAHLSSFCSTDLKFSRTPFRPKFILDVGGDSLIYAGLSVSHISLMLQIKSSEKWNLWVLFISGLRFARALIYVSSFVTPLQVLVTIISGKPLQAREAWESWPN